MKPAIAKQIAELLNSENQLVVPYTEQKIMDSKDNYLFEADDNDEVVSCIECKKVQWYQFEVCHLTVNPKHRRNGHGKKILLKAISHSKANRGRVIQCTIREGNDASSGLFLDNGFVKTSTFFYPDSGNDVSVYQKVN
ncbi:MAG: GNAT family N-acetyltransferase [Proteobacteria bacterium]|nr:GNAT family N-acetyltransferase [Pseudomonadota bacterium]